ncbi:MAG: efflux transporter periplasmic adaptor subunit [Rhizobiales bacterium 12-66-7]|uniref:HlyD family secretion protein n=1 Tax=Xanthobacteraceae TaxID=335928 RepID=UPI000BDAADDB|nr:MAG: efflux transporter periplasmic adaptor subunit [Rhizobiales bacterium 12-66-7]OYX75301.1 MAG: efflux transporter periplasmic adaptor subunit [Rhizobiales bacterium 32-66-11]
MDENVRIAPIIAVVILAAAGAAGYAYWWRQQATRVPAGLARANGRIEVERVDIATKYAGRLAEVRVNEGADVQKDGILARIDTTEILAQLAAARAAVHRSHQGVAIAESNVALRSAELKLAEVELRRIVELMRTNTATQAELDRRTAQRDISKASLDSAKVAIEDAKAAVEAAEAQVSQIEAAIADMTLKAPVSGRVEYRLAQAGEVVAVGGRVLTLLDLSDVHMTIFLPTSQVGSVELGSDARIMLDGTPGYVVPATVAFVASEAQFTPKYVETANEREKLMYRVKLHIDPKLIETYRAYVKAGMTGNAYVKVQAGAAWPTNLTPRLPDVR